MMDVREQNEVLQNIIREVNSGWTYVLSGSEAARCFPSVYHGKHLVLSTEDCIAAFASANGFAYAHDIQFDEYKLSKLTGKQLEGR